MTSNEYLHALNLLDRAKALLHQREVVSQRDFLYELRRLVRALDALRVEVGQSPPQLQRN